MMISVVNASEGALADAEVQRAIRAVNLQIEHDFAPHWGMPASLRLEGRIGKRGSRKDLAELRGDAILYILKSHTEAGGEHDIHASGAPYGFVYLDLSAGLEDDWRIGRVRSQQGTIVLVPARRRTSRGRCRVQTLRRREA